MLPNLDEETRCNEGSVYDENILYDIQGSDFVNSGSQCRPFNHVSLQAIVAIQHEVMSYWTSALLITVPKKSPSSANTVRVSSSPLAPGISLSPIASSATSTSYPFWWASRAVVLTQLDDQS